MDPRNDDPGDRSSPIPNPVPGLGGESSPPRVTVVVPAKNEGARIGNCLRSIHAQSLKAIEIIVVDGRSADRTAEIARGNGAIVLFEDYHTRAGACQVGLMGARGDYVAFTDADCNPDPQWLEALLPHLSSTVAGAGGRIVNEGNSYWSKAVDDALDTLLGSANSVQGRNFPDVRDVSSISGCNSMYRTSDLKAVGGFRTEYLTAEDTELNRRLLRRGRLVYVPDAVVVHRHGRGLRAFAKRMYQYGYGRGQVLLPGPPVILPVAAPAMVLTFVLWPAFAWALLGAYGAVVAFSALTAAVRKRRVRYLPAIPVVYVIEHAAYVVGFWVGVGHRLSRALRKPRPQGGAAP